MIAAMRRGRRRARHRAARRTSRAPPSTCRRCSTMIGTLEHKGLAYRARQRRRELRGAQVSRLRQAVGQVARRAARRRARRGARRQGRPARLRAVEGAKPDRARRRASGPSDYGPGRPGWHIECSAMACALLGEHFDIHGGGEDLQFPHHENEIAQSEGAHGKPFVNYWMHNGFVNVDNEKMSKSLGNFFTIRDVLKQLRRRDAALLHAARALPQPAQLQRRAPRRRARRADAAVHRAAAGAAGRRRAIDWSEPHAARFARRWTTTSTRPTRWPCCSSSPARSTARSRPRPPALLKALAARSACCSGDPQAFLQAGSGARRGDDPGAHRRSAPQAKRGEELRRGRPHPRRAARRRASC